jgi:hypothetical protein
MRPNSDYKMKKSTKTLLALSSGNQRHGWKRMMIDAELAEKQARTAKFKENKSDKGED